MQGLLQLVGWRNANLQDVGLICLSEHMQAGARGAEHALQTAHKVHSVLQSKLQFVLLVCVVVAYSNLETELLKLFCL